MTKPSLLLPESTVHKACFSDDWFLDSLHKSFLNQITLDLRKEKWTFLNREFTVLRLLSDSMLKGKRFHKLEVHYAF